MCLQIRISRRGWFLDMICFPHPSLWAWWSSERTDGGWIVAFGPFEVDYRGAMPRSATAGVEHGQHR